MTVLTRSLAIVGAILAFAGVQNATAQIIDPLEFTTSFPFTVGKKKVDSSKNR